ncbi:alpha/beta fold hydrolase [Actinoplanes sp. NPDC049599]|uniref:alpha/beta fold hydrolase n=1 Tax=Actinoplanes sp. NPDC049599 TaxID=3363903 RepID=UPI0037B08537
MRDIREGLLFGGLPYRAAGTGPAVVVFPGIEGDNADSSGRSRRRNLRVFRRLSRHFTVYVVNPKPGLAPGSTLSDLAGHYAEAIRREFDEPVHLIGVSTGGSIAQAFAVDHPHLLNRLVLLCSACRLSPYGRQVQRRLADLIRAGRPRAAWAATGPALAATTIGGALFTMLMWLAGGRMNPADPADLLITIAAEDIFDAAPDLPRVLAPTLVVGGARDRFYSPELFAVTAELPPSARLCLYPGKGHVGTVAHRRAIMEIDRFLT